ncbi:MAG: FMN-binding protein [Myxococcota bacterium]
MAHPAAADREVQQTPEEFIEQSFPTGEAKSKALWITGELKQEVREVLGHDLDRLRVRYWVQGPRTAWILEEIGKEEPITVGVLVDAGKIESVNILIYRESRGWEVRFPFFTDQFRGAVVGENGTQLDRGIDGISGATLSVRAIRGLARLALILDRNVEHPPAGS